ncbi:hypothetical protein MPER_06139 [Moniliophthora perniciosa FA553]|nr:hypothetical protein MPER_06139 [Moniliophthora perniciosa FA553]
MSPLDDSVSSMWGDLTVTTKKEDSNSMFGEDILSTSIPAAASSPTSGAGANSASAGVVKANKGMILRKSVEYIRQLEQELAQYRPPSSGSQNNNSSSSSSSQEGGSFTTAPSASWTGIEGAGYAGSYRILDSMPEETTTTTNTNTNEIKGMVSPVFTTCEWEYTFLC